MNPQTKVCQNCKKDFTIEPDDFSFYEKIKVPPPTFCSECRLQRRLGWRNERGLYHNKCKKCGINVISVLPENSNINVYCRPCWWADNWDGLDYGIDFDESKPFLNQLHELFLKVPYMSLFGVYNTLENSEYVNMASYLKNCYMLFHSDESENCIYGSMISGSRDCVDNLTINNCELCYENINCQKCYSTYFSNDCENCVDTWFSHNCVGCNNCFGCVNLRNSSYYIFNEKYSKEEYEDKIKELNLKSRSQLSLLKKQIKDFWLKFPNKYIHESHTSNVSGDYVYNSKNTKDSYIANDMEDSRFCSLVTPGKTTNVYDFTHYGIVADMMYETLQCGNHSSNIRFSWFTLSNSRDVEYSMFAIGSKNCFGCVGIKKREYCILNKQYTKEKYFEIIEKIKKQMDDIPYIDKKGNIYKYGEFFPLELSLFSYDITTAQESFPLSEKEISDNGYNYFYNKKNSYDITIKNNDIPDSIKEVSDSIINEILECKNKNNNKKQCSEAYKITSTEFNFYKRLELPLPEFCPNCRFEERITHRNPFRSWHRSCMNKGCTNKFETSYSPDRPEIVYCEKCYQQEVY